MLGNFVHALITPMLYDICQYYIRQVLMKFASMCGHAVGTLHHVNGRRWNAVFCWLLCCFWNSCFVVSGKSAQSLRRQCVLVQLFYLLLLLLSLLRRKAWPRSPATKIFVVIFSVCRWMFGIFLVASQPSSALGQLIVEVSRLHTIRHTHIQPVGLLWPSDKPIA